MSRVVGVLWVSVVVVGLVAVVGCGDDGGDADAAAGRFDAGAVDAAGGLDAASAVDAAVVTDAQVSIDAAAMPDAEVSIDAAAMPDGAVPDASSPDAAAPTDTTIVAVQQGSVAAGSCVRVSGVAMSLVFSDSSDLFSDGGEPVPRKAFYLSEKGLGTTAPWTGIEVVVDPDQADPAVVPGDDVSVVGVYEEHGDNSTLRVQAACGAVDALGTVAIPSPVVVTLESIGQSGGGPGCPPATAWLDGTDAEAYEGVLVRIENGAVDQTTDGAGNWQVAASGSVLRVGNHLASTTTPSLGSTVTFLIGFGHFADCRRLLRPRADADVSLAPPICGSDPASDHLLVSEIKIGPTAGELVEIYNPTGATVDLSDYYLYGATGAACSYYDTVTGTQCGDVFGDFALRFPDGAEIAAGEYQVIAITGTVNYCSVYFPALTCVDPTYEIPAPAPAGGDDPAVRNMRGVWDPSLDNFTTFGFLTSSREDIVLFEWDGVASIVRDVDYVIWGTDTAVRTDKTGVSTYLADTAVGSQDAMPGSIGSVNSYQRRCNNEGTETKTGGNGISGHDETSENLSVTWVVETPTPGAPASITFP